MGQASFWLEISVFEHWGLKPHGIPRVTQNIFTESLLRTDIKYFYYHPVREQFIVAGALDYFVALARGEQTFDSDALPDGPLFADVHQKGTRVLFSAVGWDHPAYFDRLAELKRGEPGLHVQFVIYDLIALKYPHFFTQEFGGRVGAFLEALPAACDRFVCISESTAADVRELLAPRAEVCVMPIGGDIHEDEPADAGDRISQPYVLCVGTLEIRKNHILLYYVWRKLAERFGAACPKLILVGRPGWLSGDVMYLFANDPLVKDRVEIRHDVTNLELVGLLKHCLFTVFPSFYEGWGLPAWESLFYGKVCVTSNTASLPEINPFPQLMFDPYDHQAAFDVIRTVIESPALLAQYEAQITGKFERRTWKSCFDALYRQVMS